MSVKKLRGAGLMVLFVVWISFWFLVVDPVLASLHPALTERTIMMPGEGKSSPSTFLGALTYVVLLIVIGWVTGHRSMSEDLHLLTGVVYGRSKRPENEQS